jgi:RNA polymerase sigma-70 factor, ECF subfamily
VRPWLYRIATNVCLDRSGRRSKRILPTSRGAPATLHQGAGAPLSETTWIQPYPDELLGLQNERLSPEARYEQHEAVELAFIVALQHLAARQRATLIMRDVLGFSARETAAALATKTVSVNSSLQRARSTVDRLLPERTQQATIRSLGTSRELHLVHAFAEALERNDIDALVALLAGDVTFAMPPYPAWWRGRATVIAFTAADSIPKRVLVTRANAQPALAIYRWDTTTQSYRGDVIEILSLGDGCITEITAFVGPRHECSGDDLQPNVPSLLASFGLANTIRAREPVAAAPAEPRRRWLAD